MSTACFSPVAQGHCVLYINYPLEVRKHDILTKSLDVWRRWSLAGCSVSRRLEWVHEDADHSTVLFLLSFACVCLHMYMCICISVKTCVQCLPLLFPLGNQARLVIGTQSSRIQLLYSLSACSGEALSLPPENWVYRRDSAACRSHIPTLSRVPSFVVFISKP